MAITVKQDKIQGTLDRLNARLAKYTADREKMIAKKEKQIRAWIAKNPLDLPRDQMVPEEKIPAQAVSEYEDQIESIKAQIAENEKKLSAAKDADAIATAKAEKKAAKENYISTLPGILKEFAERLERGILKAEIDRLYTLRNVTEETIAQARKSAHDDVTALCQNFMNKVTGKVGEITDLHNLHLDQGARGGVAINGYVYGTKGAAIVESIYAGGWNIQCRHIRVIVK